MKNREYKSRLGDLITVAKDKVDDSCPQEILAQTFCRRNQFREYAERLTNVMVMIMRTGRSEMVRRYWVWRLFDNDFRRGTSLFEILRCIKKYGIRAHY